MAHHHNIIQVLKTPKGYVRTPNGALEFTDDIKMARSWGYWTFVFAAPNEKQKEMEKVGLSKEEIANSEFVFHKLYELDD